MTGPHDTSPQTWLGATVRNVADADEMSALGLPGVRGVLVLEVPAGSALAKAGLRRHDVILSVNGTRIDKVAHLLQEAPALADFQSLTVGITRQQKEHVLTVTP